MPLRGLEWRQMLLKRSPGGSKSLESYYFLTWVTISLNWVVSACIIVILETINLCVK